MAKRDALSSTERLLDLIRDDRKPEYSTPAVASRQSFGQRFKNVFNNPVSFKKAISVGVDLGHDDLKLVKINRLSDRKIELLDYVRIPFDPEIPRDSARFPQFLRQHLLRFCDHSKNIGLWCTIPSARVETRQIRIPKVGQKQIANSVYWTYQRISSFNDKEKLFDFELLGETEEDGKPKIDVMAYTAPREEIKDLKDLFSRAGCSLTGISIVPFAFQSLLRSGRLETDEAHVSSLYIGRDWSRIDIFSEGNLMLSRGIKAGIKTMIEALRAEIEGNLFELSIAKSPSKDSARIRSIKKKLKYELDQAHQLFFGVIHDSPPQPLDERQRLLKEDKIFKMISPALERLVRQVERTLRHFSLHFDNARVGKIYISSGVNLHPHIVNYIGEELGIPTEAVNPFAESPNFVSLSPSPENISEQSSYAPAMGMALSNNAITPNFLFTYRDKQKAARSQRINRAVFGGFLLLMAVCVGISFWQENTNAEKEYQMTRLQQQLNAFTVRIDKNLILKLVAESRANNRGIKKLGEKYLGLAVISELADLTPANIRLLDMSARLAKQPGKKKSKAKKTLIIEGIVQGDRLTMESTLAAYIMDLKNSPLFGSPKINKKSYVNFEDKPALKFTARLDIV